MSLIQVLISTSLGRVRLSLRQIKIRKRPVIIIWIRKLIMRLKSIKRIIKLKGEMVHPIGRILFLINKKMD